MMKMARSLGFPILVVCLVTCISAQRASSTPAAAQTLDQRIQAALDGFQGKVWIYAKNLDTGKDYALRADEQTRTASTIKLAFMAETFHQVAQGKLKWDDEIVLTKEKKQGGSGILF